MIDAERAKVLLVRSKGKLPSEVVSQVLGHARHRGVDARRGHRGARADPHRFARLHWRPPVRRPGRRSPRSRRSPTRRARPAWPTAPAGCRCGSAWTCGHVGCCDSSIGKHATAHFHETPPPRHGVGRARRVLALVLRAQPHRLTRGLLADRLRLLGSWHGSARDRHRLRPPHRRAGGGLRPLRAGVRRPPGDRRGHRQGDGQGPDGLRPPGRPLRDRQRPRRGQALRPDRRHPEGRADRAAADRVAHQPVPRGQPDLPPRGRRGQGRRAPADAAGAARRGVPRRRRRDAQRVERDRRRTGRGERPHHHPREGRADPRAARLPRPGRHARRRAPPRQRRGPRGHGEVPRGRGPVAGGVLAGRLVRPLPRASAHWPTSSTAGPTTSTSTRWSTSWWSARARPGWPRACTPRARASRPSASRPRRSAARRAPAR